MVEERTEKIVAIIAIIMVSLMVLVMIVDITDKYLTEENKENIPRIVNKVFILTCLPPYDMFLCGGEYISHKIFFKEEY